NNMIKGILFDLDGTLVKLPINYTTIQEKLKNIFQTEEQFAPLIPSIISKAKGDDSKIHDAFEMICDQEVIALKNLEVMHGVKDILSFLKTKNCFLCLVTLQCNKAAMEILNKLSITGFFSNIITRDESYDRFEQIQKTIEKIKLNPEQILVIGDTIYDVECAKKAGCQSILFSSKTEREAGLKIIKNLSDLKEMVF
ncbi:MAG: HAD family hydrolase, partial [Nitrosopumilaceae archaeon]